MPDGAPEEPELRPGGYSGSLYDPIRRAEAKHFWFRSRNRVIERLVSREVRRRAGSPLVLEVGCGTGLVLERLARSLRPGARIFGLDSYPEGLPFARARVGPCVVQADASQVPFRTRFDVVGCFDVLEHLDDDLAALEGLRALLRPDGTLVLTVPAYMFLWSEFDEEAHHKRRYEKAELAARLARAGFRVDFLSYLMAALLPVAWLQRSVRPRRKGPSDPATSRAVARDLAVIPGLNAAMLAAHAWETGWIGSGRSIAFGTSLVAVARPVGPD